MERENAIIWRKGCPNEACVIKHTYTLSISDESLSRCYEFNLGNFFSIILEKSYRRKEQILGKMKGVMYAKRG